MAEDGTIGGWKKLAIRSVFFGIGIGGVLAVFAGTVIWYTSRPKPPKPWDSHKIVAKAPPGFWVGEWVSNDGKTKVPVLALRYELENTTDVDYTIESRTAVKFMFRSPNGALGADMFSGEIETSEGNQNDIHLPIFVPSKQKAYLECSFSDRQIPPQAANESAADYHERLRAYLEKTYSLSGLVIFDSVQRYEIDLPKWASSLPQNPSQKTSP